MIRRAFHQPVRQIITAQYQPSSKRVLIRRSLTSSSASSSNRIIDLPTAPTASSQASALSATTVPATEDLLSLDVETSNTSTDTDERSTGSSTATEGWSLHPQDIVHHLDRYIIGQDDAKKATAIALRVRWRRSQIQQEVRKEITPANIMMKGPTGSGKTEIARRLSLLAEAPFIKVEATRYTEVGFVGSNTNEMIKGLMDNAVRMERELAKKSVEREAREKAENKVLELLKLPNKNSADIKEKLRKGEFDHMTVKVAPKERSPANPFADMLEGIDLGNLGSMGTGGAGIISLGRPGGNRKNSRERQTLSVKQAMERFIEEYENEMTNEEEIIEKAKEKAEQFGIVFIDEIDKLCGYSAEGVVGRSAAENKGEGVQRELLTLVEGCSVQTRYGAVKTDFILFIASGAFHNKSPSDLLPELQGRFPVRVELKPLGKADLVKILSEKKFNLIDQTQRLMATEGVDIEFTQDGIEEMASFAQYINRTNQDIGARRLNTVMHRVMEDLSYSAPKLRGSKVVIDAAFVKQRVQDFDPVKKDLARYIL